jgi:hypothetical protein
MTTAGQQTADQIVEDEVRELVRRRGLDPGNGDATAVRQLIDEVVADYAWSCPWSSCSPSTRASSRCPRSPADRRELRHAVAHLAHPPEAGAVGGRAGRRPRLGPDHGHDGRAYHVV